MHAIVRLVCLWLLLGVTTSVLGVTPRWVSKRYQYAAESKPLKEVLRDFASSQGMTLSMSNDIDGVVAGRFDLKPENFIDMLSRSYGFSWYFDGVVLHVSSAKDVSSRLIKLSSGTTFQLREVLKRMGVMEKSFPIRFDDVANTALVQGPSQYVELVADIAAHVEERSAKLGSSVVRIFTLSHAQAADRNAESSGGQSLLGVASLLRNIYKKNSEIPGPSESGKTRQEQTRLLIGDEPLVSAAGNAQRRLQNSPGPDKSGAAWWDSQQKSLGWSKSPQGFQATPTLRGEGAAKTDPELELPVIIADVTNNAVIVRDFPERMDAHEALIRKFDVPVRQVEIEIHILEIQRDALEELGVDWRLHSNRLDAQTGNGKTSQNGFNGSLSGTTDPGAFTPSGAALTAVVGNAGRYFLARILALQQQGLARISARPKVATLNNQQAIMSSEQTMHVKVEAFQSAQLFSITTGTVLRVTPNATFEANDWRIKLDVHVKDGRLLDTQVSNIPVITESRIDTQAVVGHGESLLLGGYEVDTDTDKSSGIPGLSNIPIIGVLFRQRSVSNRRFQRLFLVSPRILQ
jgi:type III secretion protein C